MTKILNTTHQGDVLLIQVDDFPEHIKQQLIEKNLVQPEKGRNVIVLHHGEALKHSHVIEDYNHVKAYDLGEKEQSKMLALVVNNDTAVTHEEHGRHHLKKGFWVVGTQRESMRGVIRPVID